MWYIPPIPNEEAEGTLGELYRADMETDGYVSNTTRAWSYRPEMHALWTQLLKAVRSHLRLRTYELVTLAAARSIGCMY